MSDHGTGINFPLLDADPAEPYVDDDMLPAPPWLPELAPAPIPWREPVLWLWVPCVVSEALVELRPEEEPCPVIEITAKSIRPEVGLRITSSILPTLLPERSFTCEPMRLLARTACDPLRPVALNPLLLLSELDCQDDPELPGCPALPDCPLSDPDCPLWELEDPDKPELLEPVDESLP